jgi:hypothetical protein
MTKAKAIPTLVVEGRIVTAACSLCNRSLILPNTVGAAAARQVEVDTALERHIAEKHSGEDAAALADRE